MICLRCGHCCHHYCVVIVDDPDKGITNDNLLYHEGKGEPCKHLRGDTPGKYYCSIHDRNWYNETPCAHHGQIERGNTNCRMGEYILEKGKAHEVQHMDESTGHIC